ncbi:MAG TPA: hypothetical protein VFN10_19500 [Thermoanaerobaculia bacterium]|nr:hypothetical protein [Thermoanaerobaculia bacterium]
MRITYRFGYRSLVAHNMSADCLKPTLAQLHGGPAHSRPIATAAPCAEAQRTLVLVAAMLALALLCSIPAAADEPWSKDTRALHNEGFPEGVTTQALMGGDLAPDPLAPEAGTVGYIVHTKGEAWAAVIIYDPTTAKYRQVCGLLAPFENASDIEAFDPLLRSVLRTVHERGFPARSRDYTPDLRTMDLAQYDERPAEPSLARGAAPPQRSSIDAPPPTAPQWVRSAQETVVLIGVAGAAIVLTILCVALVLSLWFRHREQMAVVRTATRPAQATPQPTPQPNARPRPRPTAVPAPISPVAKQKT